MPYIPKKKKKDFIKYPLGFGIRIYESIRERNDLSWSEKVFLSEIVYIDQETHGLCYFDKKSLAKLFFVDPLSISNWTQKLKKMGFLRIETKIHEEIGTFEVLIPTYTALSLSVAECNKEKSAQEKTP